MRKTLTASNGLVLTLREDQRLELSFGPRSLTGPLTCLWTYFTPDGDEKTLRLPELRLTQLVVEGAQLRLEAAPVEGVTLGLSVVLTEVGLELTPRLALDTHEGPDWIQLEAFVLEAGQLTGSFLEGVGEHPGWRFFPLAYNSFSPAYVRDSRAILSLPRFYTAGTFNQHTRSPYWGSWSELHTAWMAVLKPAQRSDALLVGWMSARQGLGEVALRRRLPTVLEARLSFSRRHLLPGAQVEGDGLLLAYAEHGEQLLPQYADQVAMRMGARVPSGPVPTGWCSWYYYYTDVHEAELRRNLDLLVQNRKSLPVKCLQLDDGYQTAVGDWLSVNKKFPSGLEALAKRIAEEGFMPGLWTAPFMVQRSSAVYKKHRDWLLKERDGSLKTFGYHPIWGVTSGQVYCLDPTHPGVQQHLRTVYSTLRGYGFTFFKIDFLNAGLQPGLHHDRRRSPVEAFRQGLEIIREAIGDAYLLGCGAPLLPCVGVVDAMRISSDVKEAWDDKALGFISNGNGHPAAELAILNSMTRAFLHQRWWFNDPDCLLVREKRSSLTEVEVRTLLTVLSLTGGMLLLSDDLTQLSVARRGLAELALPVRGPAARALGVLDEERPRRFVRARVLADGTQELLGTWINWGETREERALSPKDFGLEEGSWLVYDYWTDHCLRLEPGEKVSVRLEAHECALLLFRRCQAYPQVVTATHHVGQTTAVVEEELWDPVRRRLRVKLNTGAERVGRLVLAEPEGFERVSIEVEGEGQFLGTAPAAVSSPVGISRHRVRIDSEAWLTLQYASPQPGVQG